MNSEIAIIGMAGRFPEAASLNEFWNNLREGKECITFFSDEELNSSTVSPSLIQNPSYVPAKGIVEGIELFDASFFGFTPREAEILDPQQRLFLECAWKALEDAGCDSERFKGSIGVYASCSTSSYLTNNLLANAELAKSVSPFQIQIGNQKDQLPTRVSYKLNFNGPSIAIQTACSSSLVAVVSACQSLLSYQCDIALAGGVTLAVPQKVGYLYQEGMIASPDGHCRAFDAKAKGTVFGEGVGIVILKRLEEALSDGDPIRAIIRGAAVNNDGAHKVGYTAPSVRGQAEVIAMAQAIAGVEADTIGYVEAHGTGTELGDYIEVEALTKAFRASTTKSNFCAIGSVKTNIGHSDTAAGIAGLIKTVLALEHKILPPSLHFVEPNPKIDFENSPFYVNSKLSEWKSAHSPRRAGVSSFGIGGTNAHVIVEEAPSTIETRPLNHSSHLLLLSAKTVDALERTTQNLKQHLSRHPHINLADVAYTLQTGRKGFMHRRMVIAENVNDAVLALETLKTAYTGVKASENQTIAFMFPGHGAQYVQMGLDLYRNEPVFRREIDSCSEILRPHLGIEFRHLLYPESGDIEKNVHDLNQPKFAQPALFIIEYALAKLLAVWGIRPQAMIGHGLGEYAAACLSGVFTLEEALKVVAMRGNLIQEQFPQASNPEMMESLMPRFEQYLATINLKPPRERYLSSVSGAWIRDSEATDPRYWSKHLCHTVRFSEGMTELMRMPGVVFLEVGPGRTLCEFAGQQPSIETMHLVASTLPSDREHGSDYHNVLNTLGRLWVHGVEANWDGFYSNEKRRRISLPTYPFERRRFWIEPQKETGKKEDKEVLQERKKDISEWFYVPTWKRSTLNGASVAADGERSNDWLIFMDESGIGLKIAERLKRQKKRVINVWAGAKFGKIDEGAYTINPKKFDDYVELLKDLKSYYSKPIDILHLWSITHKRAGGSEIENLENSQYLGLYSLLFLSKVVREIQRGNKIDIIAVTNNTREITGGDILYPEKSTLFGACKIIPQEYENVRCRNIDIAVSESSMDGIDRTVDQLFSEIMIKTSDPVVGYRGPYRWVESFEPVRLNRTQVQNPRFRKRGVYLITGGLGGMGLALAQYLGETLMAKLILLGRSEFPPKSEWESWIQIHGSENPISRKIQQLRTLENYGAECLVVNADVADLERMRTQISASEKVFGPIEGVFHTAGIIDQGGMIQRRTIEDTEKVLAPKVKGTLVLDSIFEGRKLNFFVLFSSLGSLLSKSKFGEVGYCAANEFLDTFSYYRFSRTGAFTVTINWDDWKDAGMTVRAVKDYRERWGIDLDIKGGVSSPEGIEALMRILESEHARVILSTRELEQTIERQKNYLEISEKRKTSVREKHPEDQLSQPNAIFQNDIEAAIAEIWQEVLGIESLGIYDDFFEIGGDSLVAAQVISRIKSIFNVDIEIQSIFDFPTISGMSQMINELLTEQIEGMSDEEVEKILTMEGSNGF